MKSIVKLIAYILAIIVIISGIVCGIWAYKLITRKSYIEGDLSGIENVYKTTNFYYKTNLALYDSENYEDIYTFEIDLKPLEDFNGLTKKYEVYFNEREVLNPKISAGAIEFSEEVEFLDIYNQIVKQATINVQTSFLENKTKLKVVVEVSDKAYTTQYFNNNAFKLSIREIKE